MRAAPSCAQVNECTAGQSSGAGFDQEVKRYLLQRWKNLRLPFIASRVGIFGVNALRRVLQTGLNVFQAVGFLADILDLLDPNVTALQKTNCLFVTYFSIGTR